MLELYHNFFTEVRRVGNGHSFSVSCSCREGTGRLHPTRNESRVGALAVERLQRWFQFWCSPKFLPPKVLWKAQKIEKIAKREPGLFKLIKHTEMLFPCSKTYSCYDFNANNYKLSNKGLNKRVLEENGDRPEERHRRVLDENRNNTSTNRGFCTNNHAVATYEQNKRLFYFHPRRVVESDGSHTELFNL